MTGALIYADARVVVNPGARGGRAVVELLVREARAAKRRLAARVAPAPLRRKELRVGDAAPLGVAGSRIVGFGLAVHSHRPAGRASLRRKGHALCVILVAKGAIAEACARSSRR